MESLGQGGKITLIKYMAQPQASEVFEFIPKYFFHFVQVLFVLGFWDLRFWFQNIGFVSVHHLYVNFLAQ